MLTVILRPADLERDFKTLADWFTILEDDLNTEPGLKEYYDKEKHRIIHKVAVGDQEELLGFYWTTRDRLVTGRQYFYLFVKPEQRGQGIGRRLYQDLEQNVLEAQVSQLRVSIWDNCPECREFIERRGFYERSHKITMELELNSFDDRPYEVVIDSLKGEGFLFTSMEELGNTEEAQRRLYALNDMTSVETPGTDGEHPWDSFEDFQRRVCQSDWYKPAGQKVVIDTNTGNWVGMSAITRLEGVDYAYNLHTGVDRRYRGRKLGQAVKVTALRFAREVLKVNTVRTHHNTKNLPMIAIDRKFGYIQLPGTYLMEKNVI